MPLARLQPTIDLMAKILYIEDDRMLGALVVDWLEANHHLVEWVKDGQDALDRVKSYEYDILIVDLSDRKSVV